MIQDVRPPATLLALTNPEFRIVSTWFRTTRVGLRQYNRVIASTIVHRLGLMMEMRAIATGSNGKE